MDFEGLEFMLKECHSVDIVIAGGGPAGISAALSLSRFGYRVMLVERSRFPRRHIGESLAPGIAVHMEQLGVRDRFCQIALPIRTTNIAWDEIEPVITASADDNALGFVVDRAALDDMLLNAARDSGTEIVQPAELRIRNSDCDDGARISAPTVEILQRDGACIHLRPRFLIDGTGRQGLSIGRRKRVAPPTLALYGYWRGCDRLRPHIGATFVEAAPWGWAWGARLQCGTLVTAVFSDLQDRTDSDERRYGSIESKLRGRLNELSLFERSADWKLDGSVRGVDCGSCYSSELVGMHWIRIGEAAFSIDPLSAQGVQSAMRSGLVAATTVHTCLQKPDRQPLARQFYRERIEETVRHHRAISASYYRRASRFISEKFWRTRSVDPAPARQPPSPRNDRTPSLDGNRTVRLSNDSHWVDAAVIDGEFVDRRNAIVSGRLERPIAFVNGVPIEELLRPLNENGSKVAALMHHWNSRYGRRRSQQLWDFVCQRDLVEVS